MSGEIDLFKQMTNAVLDLQSAQLQSYARPLKTLARLLRHSDLAPANSALTQDLDLDVFLTESEKSQGGMVGSAQLAWPESSEKMLGLTLLLIERFAEDPGFALDVNAAKRAEERGQRESFHFRMGSWCCAQPGRGELKMGPPVGLVGLTASSASIPTPRCQSAIRLVFETFERTGSAVQTVSLLQGARPAVPSRADEECPSSGLI